MFIPLKMVLIGIDPYPYEDHGKTSHFSPAVPAVLVSGPNSHAVSDPAQIHASGVTSDIPGLVICNGVLWKMVIYSGFTQL